MASPPTINCEELLNPIPGDNPAGVPFDSDFTVEQDLDAARKDYEPHPEGPVPKKPDWGKIIKICTDQLTKKSKDLRLACRLTEALTKQYGFAGLRDGLELVWGLVEKSWDHLYPRPDVDAFETMEIRGELLSSSLSDPNSGLTFPHTVRQVPLVEIDGKPRSLYDKRLADEGREGLEYTRGDFDRARPWNDQVAGDLDQAVEQLHRLIRSLDDKLEGHGPSFSKLDEALLECRQLLAHVIGEPAPEQTGGETTNHQGGSGGLSPISLSGKAIATREEAYRQLAQIASALEQIEPHSPIPDLLRRCVELGKMPFRQLIREIVRDQSLLAEVKREFGIKESQAPESE